MGEKLKHNLLNKNGFFWFENDENNKFNDIIIKKTNNLGV